MKPEIRHDAKYNENRQDRHGYLLMASQTTPRIGMAQSALGTIPKR